jgi:hypothetical protein
MVSLNKKVVQGGTPRKDEGQGAFWSYQRNPSMLQIGGAPLGGTRRLGPRGGGASVGIPSESVQVGGSSIKAGSRKRRSVEPEYAPPASIYIRDRRRPFESAVRGHSPLLAWRPPVPCSYTVSFPHVYLRPCRLICPTMSFESEVKT